jgi:hypothetical protein
MTWAQVLWGGCISTGSRTLSGTRHTPNRLASERSIVRGCVHLPLCHQFDHHYWIVAPALAFSIRHAEGAPFRAAWPFANMTRRLCLRDQASPAYEMYSECAMPQQDARRVALARLELSLVKCV